MYRQLTSWRNSQTSIGLVIDRRQCDCRFFLNSVMIDVQSQGKRVTGTPWALATASVCNLVSAMIFAVFEAVTTRANSRLCGGPPAVKLKTRSAAPSLGDASVSNMLTNVSRSTASFDPENGDNTFVDRTAAKHMLRRGLQKKALRQAAHQ